MSSSKFILFFPALLASFYLESSLHAQEKFKKIRVTYPTESIAVLTLFAAGGVGGLGGAAAAVRSDEAIGVAPEAARAADAAEAALAT